MIHLSTCGGYDAESERSPRNHLHQVPGGEAQGSADVQSYASQRDQDSADRPSRAHKTSCRPARFQEQLPFHKTRQHQFVIIRLEG